MKQITLSTTYTTNYDEPWNFKGTGRRWFAEHGGSFFAESFSLKDDYADGEPAVFENVFVHVVTLGSSNPNTTWLVFTAERHAKLLIDFEDRDDNEIELTIIGGHSVDEHTQADGSI